MGQNVNLIINNISVNLFQDDTLFYNFCIIS